MLKELLLSLSFLQSPDMLVAQQVENAPSTTPDMVREIKTLRQESILPTATDCYAGGKNLVDTNRQAESIYKYSPEQLSKISPSFQGLIDASVYQDNPEAREDIKLLVQYIINFQQQSGVMIQGAQGYDVNAIGLSNHNILPSNDDQYGTIKSGQISPYRLKSAIEDYVNTIIAFGLKEKYTAIQIGFTNPATGGLHNYNPRALSNKRVKGENQIDTSSDIRSVIFNALFIGLDSNVRVGFHELLGHLRFENTKTKDTLCLLRETAKSVGSERQLEDNVSIILNTKTTFGVNPNNLSLSQFKDIVGNWPAITLGMLEGNSNIPEETYKFFEGFGLDRYAVNSLASKSIVDAQRRFLEDNYRGQESNPAYKKALESIIMFEHQLKEAPTALAVEVESVLSESILKYDGKGSQEDRVAFEQLKHLAMKTNNGAYILPIFLDLLAQYNAAQSPSERLKIAQLMNEFLRTRATPYSFGYKRKKTSQTSAYYNFGKIGTGE